VCVCVLWGGGGGEGLDWAAVLGWAGTGPDGRPCYGQVEIYLLSTWKINNNNNNNNNNKKKRHEND